MTTSMTAETHPEVASLLDRTATLLATYRRGELADRERLTLCNALRETACAIAGQRWYGPSGRDGGKP